MYIIKRMRIMSWLKQHGIEAVSVIPDRDNPTKYSVWVYEDTQELHIALDAYHNRDRSLDIKS